MKMVKFFIRKYFDWYEYGNSYEFIFLIVLFVLKIVPIV